MSTIFHIVSNKEWGGGEQYVFDLAQRQKADNITVKVFCKPIADIVAKYKTIADQVFPARLNGVTDFQSAFAMAKVVRHAGK